MTPLTLAQVTDLHLDDDLALRHGLDSRGQARAVLQAVRESGVTRVVLTGDLGEPEALPWVEDCLAGLGLNALRILGNHDDPAAWAGWPGLRRSEFDDALVYRETLGGYEAYFLDSRTNRVGAEQLSWLRDALARGQDPALVFVHHPVLDCGTQMDRLFPLLNRDQVRSVLEASGRELVVVSGHYHAEHEVRQGRLTQWVTPSTALQFAEQGEGDDTSPGSRAIGYREIRLGGDGWSSRVVTVPFG